MADHHATPKSTVNFNDYLKLVNNPDGSVSRLVTFPTTAASPDDTTRVPVLSKDILVNPAKNIWVRVFLAREALESSSAPAESSKKLPLIVYFHGGGFVICSAATTVFHDLCADLAEETCSVVISAEYRLPAAYDDGAEVLHWIANRSEVWVVKYADVTRCFLMGSSAEGNQANFAALRVGDSIDDLKPRIDHASTLFW